MQLKLNWLHENTTSALAGVELLRLTPWLALILDFSLSNGLEQLSFYKSARTQKRRAAASIGVCRTPRAGVSTCIPGVYRAPSTELPLYGLTQRKSLRVHFVTPFDDLTRYNTTDHGLAGSRGSGGATDGGVPE